MNKIAKKERKPYCLRDLLNTSFLKLATTNFVTTKSKQQLKGETNKQYQH